jgi:iron(III) transport system substrate-binding protein
MRSAHALVKEKPGRTPLKDIKLMKDDAAAVEKQSEAIKTRYTQIFKV